METSHLEANALDPSPPFRQTPGHPAVYSPADDHGPVARLSSDRVEKLRRKEARMLRREAKRRRREKRERSSAAATRQKPASNDGDAGRLGKPPQLESRVSGDGQVPSQAPNGVKSKGKGEKKRKAPVELDGAAGTDEVLVPPSQSQLPDVSRGRRKRERERDDGALALNPQAEGRRASPNDGDALTSRGYEDPNIPVQTPGSPVTPDSRLAPPTSRPEVERHNSPPISSNGTTTSTTPSPSTNTKQPANPRANPSKSVKPATGMIAPHHPAAGPSQPRAPGIPNAPELLHPDRSRKGKPTDDELRKAFDEHWGSMHIYLASKWIQPKELQRLEDAGILTYRKGKFSSEETERVKMYLDRFKQENRLDADDLANIIMAKGTGSERSAYARFWPEVAAVLPGRPVRYVKRHVQRVYDPRGQKGTWSPEEDRDLLRAFQVHPDEWVKIAAVVGRTEENCKDRYRNHLREASTCYKGQWTPLEEATLVKCVKKANRQLGIDESSLSAPWDVVCTMMGGKRTRLQCREKWRDTPRLRDSNAVVAPSRQNATPAAKLLELVDRLKALNLANEMDIKWSSLVQGSWADATPVAIRQAYRRQKRKIDGYINLTFRDTLDAIGIRIQNQTKIARSSSSPQKPYTSREEVESDSDESPDYGDESEGVAELLDGEARGEEREAGGLRYCFLNISPFPK